MTDRPVQLRFLSPLHRATRQISEFLAPRMAVLGCSNDEAHLLSYVAVYGPCPIGQIKQVFGHRGSTLTSMLDRIEGRGLISRSPHPEDRRSTLILATEAGRDAARVIREELETLEASIAARLEPAAIDGFRAVSRAIEQATTVPPQPIREPKR